MRIVIDGTVGAGKTSLLIGTSQRDMEHKTFQSFKSLGYPVFSDLVINVIKEMRNNGISDPADNWDLFFSLAVEHSIKYYNESIPNTINFYDRGIFYLEILANRYNCLLPDEYYKFCSNNRYDDPVFIFEPILSLDMSNPHITDNKQKKYSLQERIEQHKQIINLYKSNNYQVIEVPLKYDDPWESADYRLSMIKEVLGI